MLLYIARKGFELLLHILCAVSDHNDNGIVCVSAERLSWERGEHM